MLKQNQYNPGKKSLAVLLMALLILLTSINFFFYTEKISNQAIALSETNAPDDGAASFPEKDEPSPQGPDEKAPGNPVSFSEEYLHESSDLSALYSTNLVHQLILVCTKVARVHFEIIVPPPNTIC